jgi:hypothetical protein
MLLASCRLEDRPGFRCHPSIASGAFARPREVASKKPRPFVKSEECYAAFFEKTSLCLSLCSL